MARTCSICSSQAHQRIDAALAAGSSIPEVAVLFGVSKEALKRHSRNHLRPRLEKAMRMKASTLQTHPNTDRAYDEGSNGLLPNNTLTPPGALVDPDILGALDLVAIVHQQFTDLEAAKQQLKASEDARGVAVVSDLILKHADKIAPPAGNDITLQPADLIKPLTEKLLLLAENHPAIKDDLTNLLLEIEHAG